MPTPKKRKAAKKPTRKKRAARNPRKSAKAKISPSKTAKAKRAAARRAATKRKKAAEAAMARPNSKLLEEVSVGGLPTFWDRYIEAIDLGLKKKERAFFAGCDPSTPREWDELAIEDFDAGRATVFTRFYIACRQAETARIADGMRKIKIAREAGDWRAAAWELERSGYGAPAKQLALSGSLQTGTFPTDDQDDEIAGSVNRDDER